MNPENPREPSNTILTVNQLGIEFLHDSRYHKAADSVSFTLSRGGSLGIVGESGSGKSVTALAIAGLLPAAAKLTPESSIVFQTAEGANTNLLQLNEREMRRLRGNRIAMIFQEPMTSLNPTQRCGWQVMENVLIHEKINRKAARARAISLLEEVKLPDPQRVFKAYPHQLSGGQKQRVMIAMALICNPDILIADEPTTALDVTVQKAILDLLQSLQKKHGISLIFISHDLNVVASIAKHVVVMHEGRTVETGTASQIFRNPQHAYTKGLLACQPAASTRNVKLKTIADFITGDWHATETAPEIISPKAAGSPPLLTTENLQTVFTLKKRFGKPAHKLFAVANVSFEIFTGETLGLVGESGCGKTTLGRTLLRLVEPSSGEIFYRNLAVTRLKPKELRLLRKKIQIVFQDPYSSLNPRFTVGETIMEPMRVHGLHKNEAGRRSAMIGLLQRVGLSLAHAGRYPHEFSGGQRQRISIARALAVQPEFIILDESVSALDVSVQAQVLNLLNDLKREFGLTYLFISHDLSVVRYMSDRVMVMSDGKIIETADPEEMYKHPKTDYTRKLLEAIPSVIDLK